MAEKKTAPDGAPHDGVGHDFADFTDFAQYKKASDALSRLKVPILAHADNAHEVLFIVGFDGTGNNKFTDPDHATNIAKIHDQIELGNEGGKDNVYPIYIEGPGTQRDWLTATLDSAKGFTYESNIDHAYDDLVREANHRMRADPDAVIRVHSMGFSRGASQAAGFARYLHDKGIPNLLSETQNADGVPEYRDYLVNPGKVVQTIGLMDPVATGHPMKFDRRLPPSVVSGFQITSADERRASFPSDQIIPPGLSGDGRFLNVMVSGAHSDVGGGYLRDGLAIRCGNLMRDYCNALQDEPYLKKEFEPVDRRLNVVHHSTQGELLFRVDPRVGIRGTPSGTNDLLAPRTLTHAGQTPHKPEAVDPHLAETLSHRTVAIGPLNTVPDRASLPDATLEELRESSRIPRLAPKAVHLANVASTAWEGATALNAMHESQKQGNAAGADSVALHFLSRNAGGLAGAHTLMAAGAAAGVETGPGMLLTGAIGSVAGYIAGDKIADEFDRYRINHQADTQGNVWRRDGADGWVQDIPALPATPHGERLVADAALSNQLTYQASNTAVEIALATEYQPRDPFKQPASPADTASVSEAPWTHNPETHQWTRQVVDRYLEHGVVSSHQEIASPQRTAELDQLAEKTIAQNVAESPLGVAERYHATYEERGWAKHGPIPSAVQHALQTPTDKVIASDGHMYARSSQDQWERPGMVYGTNEASGNVREELDVAERFMHGMKGYVDTADMLPPAQSPRIPSRLDDPLHPDHEFFSQVRNHVVALDERLGRSPDHYTDSIASALAVQARAAGLKRVDQIELSDDRSQLWAIETRPGRTDHLFSRDAVVPTSEANTPMEQSGEKWPEAMQQFQDHEQERAETTQRAQDQVQADRAIGPSMGL